MGNRLNIEVYGLHYPIVTQEDPDYVYSLGDQIDSSVKKIIDKSSASLTQALVLTALSYLDSYKKAEANADNLREQVSEYLEEAARAKKDLSDALVEIERLGRNQQLQLGDN